MNSAPLQPYHIECIQSEERLFELRDAWTALLASAPDAPIFLSWEWITTWWRHYGEERQLWILAAWNHADQLIGLAPWMLTYNRLGPLSARQIAFIGSGIVAPDHLDIVVMPSAKAKVYRSFIDYLNAHSKEWNVLDLQGLSQNSMLAGFVSGTNGRHMEREEVHCPYILLPRNWDAYQMQWLSANRRQQIRRHRRRLERDYPEQVVFHCITTASEVAVGLDSLIALHHKRWGPKGQPTPFNSNTFVAFHREIATLAFEQDWLRLYQLKVAGSVVAAQYCFCYGDTFYDYQSGLDPEFAHYRPGQLLLAHVIHEAIKTNARKFDMLRGVHGYKSSWTDTATTDSNILLSRSWQSHPWLVGAALFDMGKSLGRKVLSPSIKMGLERILASRYI